MKKHTKIFYWDYKEQPPFIEMLKFSRKHPELHLFQIYDGGYIPYDVYVFAFDAATAKLQASKKVYGEYPIERLNVNKCF